MNTTSSANVGAGPTSGIVPATLFRQSRLPGRRRLNAERRHSYTRQIQNAAAVLRWHLSDGGVSQRMLRYPLCGLQPNCWQRRKAATIDRRICHSSHLTLRPPTLTSCLIGMGTGSRIILRGDDLALYCGARYSASRRRIVRLISEQHGLALVLQARSASAISVMRLCRAS